MTKKVSVDEASKVLGMSPTEVRVRMQRNLFDPPIGRILPSMSGKQTRYFIYEDMLNAFIGKK